MEHQQPGPTPGPSSYSMLSSHAAVLQELCRLRGAWGLYLSHVPSAGIGPYELARAVPFLDEAEASSLWHNDRAWLFFPDEAGLLDAFRQVVGDDGPTDLNDYDGPARVYALTCSPASDLLDENT